MALVIAATSLGECVPIGASLGAADAAVLTDVFTEETEATAPEDTDAARSGRDDAMEASVLEA